MDAKTSSSTVIYTKLPRFSSARACCRIAASFTVLVACVLLPAAVFAIGPLGAVKVGTTPGPVAVNPSAHSVYVVNQGSNSVSVIDAGKLTIKKTITVGSNPVAIAANPPSNMVYVANSGAGTISEITGTDAAVTWQVGGQPSMLVVDSFLNQLYVADTTLKQVEILDAKKGTVLATLSTTKEPTAMALNVATHALFVACTGSAGSVVVIDGTQNKILTTVTSSLPAGISSISVDPATNIAMVASPSASASNAIAIINAGNGYSVQDEGGTKGANPVATAFDAGGLFLVADQGDGDVYFAPGTGIITLGNAFQTDMIGFTTMAASPTTNQVGIIDPGGETAFVLDLLNPLFPANYHQLTTGKSPAGLAFDPITSRVFITNSGDGNVSVFDVSPRTVVPAYEGNYSESDLDYDYIDSNPATGTVYTLRLGNLFAINEAKAAAGDNGMSGDAAGVTTIPLSSIYSETVAVNAATNKIYVGDSSGFFYSVDGTSNVATLITSVPAATDIRSLAIDSATNEIIAWDYHSDNVYVLDGSTEKVVKTIPVGSSNPGFVLMDSTKNLAYAALDAVYVLDPTAGTVVATIALPNPAYGAAINPAKERLYVLSSQHITVIDTSKNSVITNIPITGGSPTAVAVNPVTGNFYVGLDEAGEPHVLVYKETTNKLIVDLSGATYPAITGNTDIKANPLTNTVYVGSGRSSATSLVAAIDGNTNVVSAVLPSAFETAAEALTVDLGSSVLAGAGYSYTSLWFPTSDVAGIQAVPISVTMQPISDADTIATTPLFRTTNTRPSFTLSATSTLAGNSAALVPKHAFYQVDGWQGTWSAAPLTAKAGQTVSHATVKPAALSTGRHILYVFASLGDVATVQDGNPNSPVISPIASIVFTVEK